MATDSRRVSVTVEPLPSWLEAARLLGAPAAEREPLEDGSVRVRLALAKDEAAYLAARLRGLGIAGRPLRVQIAPPLSRSEVRAGRLAEARAQRDTTPGFTRKGAQATGEGRYSLTPEALALALGERAAGRSVVDACAGSGGNSIGFARAGCRVTAIERDRARLAEAQHNSAVYGVSPRIEFVPGDALEEVPRRSAEILFVDPPWGEQYDRRRTERASFPLLDALLRCDLSRYDELWLKLPSSFDVASLPHAEATAWFGLAAGDRHRIKFLLLTLRPAPGGT